VVFSRAVKYSIVKAGVLNSDVEIRWKVADEFNISSYEIERSADGSKFTGTGTKVYKGSGGKTVSYAALDEKPAPGEYYYRIKTITDFGMEVYSDVVKVKIVKASDEPYVFPNPVTDNSIQLQLTNAPAGKYSIRLLHPSGQLIYSKAIAHTGGTATKIITSSQALTGGSYQLEVTGPDTKRSLIKIMLAPK
jgi:hypothetical protein